jgi:RND family efflux transporter MFP subunit
MRNLVIGLILLGLLGFLGWKIYAKFSEEEPAGAAGAPASGGGPMGGRPGGGMRGGAGAVIAVEIQPVRVGPIDDFRLFSGSLEARSRFIVAPKIAGRLDKLMVRIGDRVQNGQLVAQLDSDEIEQQINQSRADTQVARAQVEQSLTALDSARKEYDRIVTLRKKDIVPQSKMDETESFYKSAQARQKVVEAQLREREASLRAMEVRQDYTRLTASWEDGGDSRIVGQRFADEGAMLGANTPLVSIVEINPLIAVINAIERDYPFLRLEQEAIISTDAFPNREFKGRIARVAPILQENSRQARVEIEVDNPDEVLKPGMFARVRILLDHRDAATLVPQTAVVKRDGKTGVFLAQWGETPSAKFTPITLGIQTPELAEVLEPALEGDVVTLGQHMLTDGAKIILPGQAPGSGKPSEGKPGSGKSTGGKPGDGQKPEAQPDASAGEKPAPAQ